MNAAAFLQQERDAFDAFRRKHINADYTQPAGLVSYARIYTCCDCGQRMIDPRAVLAHVKECRSES